MKARASYADELCWTRPGSPSPRLPTDSVSPHVSRTSHSKHLRSFSHVLIRCVSALYTNLKTEDLRYVHHICLRCHWPIYLAWLKVRINFQWIFGGYARYRLHIHAALSWHLLGLFKCNTNESEAFSDKNHLMICRRAWHIALGIPRWTSKGR